MSGPENTFISSVHRHLPTKLYRMKNHNAYNSGIADVWYDGANDMWSEYKFIVVPKRDTTMVDLVGGKNPSLSRLQQQWLRDRYENGRRVNVIVGSRDGGVVLEHRSWEQPFTAAWYRKHLMTRRALAEFITSVVNG
jgi:hypothetical protein